MPPDSVVVCRSIFLFVSFLCQIDRTYEILPDTLSTLSLERYSLSILDINDFQTAKFVDDAISKRLETVTTRSRSGQSFVCYLPSIEDFPTDSNNTKNESTVKITNEQITQRLKSLTSTNWDGSIPTCPQVNQGWWTYEFCFGTQITQFHAEGKSASGSRSTASGSSMTLSLGHFSHETVWDNETFSVEELRSRQTIRYHSQYYRNGSKCELTGAARETQVKFYCAPQLKISINEPSTCNYVVVVNTPVLCDLPVFKKMEDKEQHFERIACVPNVPIPRPEEAATDVKEQTSDEIFEHQITEEPIHSRDIVEEIAGDIDELSELILDRVQMEAGLADTAEQNQLTGLQNDASQVEGSTLSEDTQSAPKPFNEIPEKVDISDLQIEEQGESIITENQLRASSEDGTDLKDLEKTLPEEKSKLLEQMKQKRNAEQEILAKLQKSEGEEIYPEFSKLLKDAVDSEIRVKKAVQQLDELMKADQVPVVLLTSIRLIMTTIDHMIETFAKRNVQVLFESALLFEQLSGKNTAGYMGRQAVKTVKDYIAGLTESAYNLEQLLSLIDFHTTVLPSDSEIEKMNFEQLKALFALLSDRYEIDTYFKKVIERLVSDYENLNEKLDEEKEQSDDHATNDQKDKAQLTLEQVLQSLRDSMKHTRQYFFTVEAHKFLNAREPLEETKTTSIVDPDTIPRKKPKSSVIEELKRRRAQKASKDPPLGFTPKPSELEEYKAVMLNGDRWAKLLNILADGMENPAKMVVKVKLSQLPGAEDGIDGGILGSSNALKDEITIQVDEKDLPMDALADNVQELEVHFLAVGSNEEYEKLLKSPEQLAAVIKTALKNGQSLMVEGDSRSSLSAVKVQLEHSHLTDRYWHSYGSNESPKSTSDGGQVYVGNSNEYESGGGSHSSGNGDEKSDDRVYSRNYHLV
ncbi:uncharacterized protein LOC142334808 isoform X3 [Convolutriloba macropyga]|uniref:uncharacterized protein LOC142334808 isoform X3 n=1 Tax=Convolutriloba macropyga TaxID=536237 RepID=UPI003F51AE68